MQATSINDVNNYSGDQNKMVPVGLKKGISDKMTYHYQSWPVLTTKTEFQFLDWRVLQHLLTASKTNQILDESAPDSFNESVIGLWEE